MFHRRQVNPICKSPMVVDIGVGPQRPISSQCGLFISAERNQFIGSRARTTHFASLILAQSDDWEYTKCLLPQRVYASDF